MTTVVNLFAGPGAGKSTTAAGLFYKMKLMDLKVELVTEFAKELVYAGNHTDLNNQLLVLAEQDRRMRRLVGTVDYIITDSPLLLTAVYGSGFYKGEWLLNAAKALHESYERRDFFIKRAKVYQAYGRTQTEEQALDVDEKVLRLEPYQKMERIDGSPRAPDAILSRLGLLH